MELVAVVSAALVLGVALAARKASRSGGASSPHGTEADAARIVAGGACTLHRGMQEAGPGS